MINNILWKYLNISVIAYLNDILIYLNILKEHEIHIKQIFKKFKKKELRLKPKKYEFYKKIIEFLGFVIRRNGIWMDLIKIKTLLEWEILTKVKKI